MIDRAGFEPAIYGLKDRRLNLTWLPTGKWNYEVGTLNLRNISAFSAPTSYLQSGWQDGAWTRNLRFNRAPLYLLSYLPIKSFLINPKFETPFSNRIGRQTRSKRSLRQTKDKYVRCKQKVWIFQHSFVLTNFPSAFVLVGFRLAITLAK